MIDESTLVYSPDVAILEKGKAVFTRNNCGSCHRNDGGGNAIGPNLTDEYWLHGGGLKTVFTTIKNGVVEKGMPAWGKAMSPGDVRDVAFFVMSLQGTKPANAKASQGELYEPEVKTEKTDSTKTQAVLK
ncbi:MAG: c-type cytochrome [Bacteroidetes bacterium]|nr:c-type cytochrome [Bacteroidota bacterium]